MSTRYTAAARRRAIASCPNASAQSWPAFGESPRSKIKISQRCRKSVAACQPDDAAEELSQDLLHDVSVHVRQPEVAAGVAIGEPGVVDTHEVQNRRMVVVHVAWIGDNLDAVFVRLPADGSTFYPGAH